MRRIIFTGLLLAAMAGCQSDDTEATNEPVAIEFTTVQKSDNISTSLPSGNFAVNSQEELDAFTSTFSPQPPIVFPSVAIDFSAKTLIMAIDELHPNLGYDLNIVSVTKYSDHIVVDVNKTENIEGVVLPMETRPYHVITIPKTNLPITFE